MNQTIDIIHGLTKTDIVITLVGINDEPDRKDMATVVGSRGKYYDLQSPAALTTQFAYNYVETHIGTPVESLTYATDGGSRIQQDMDTTS